jgi:hypothetical protein
MPTAERAHRVRVTGPPWPSWEYHRPTLAGYYWWQESPEDAPRIVELTCSMAGTWIAAMVRSLAPVPRGRGRWCYIELPQAFEEWKR